MELVVEKLLKIDVSTKCCKLGFLQRVPIVPLVKTGLTLQTSYSSVNEAAMFVFTELLGNEIRNILAIH